MWLNADQGADRPHGDGVVELEQPPSGVEAVFTHGPLVSGFDHVGKPHRRFEQGGGDVRGVAARLEPRNHGAVEQLPSREAHEVVCQLVEGDPIALSRRES